MHKALWITRKNYLCSLIKKVSDGHGGDEPEFLEQHCKEVIESHPDEKIEEAIRCYQEMVEQLKLYSKKELECKTYQEYEQKTLSDGLIKQDTLYPLRPPFQRP